MPKRNRIMKPLLPPRKHHGEDHAGTAVAYNNLAGLYDHLGKFADAERCTASPWISCCGPPEKSRSAS